jgi:hypothetical protein
MTDKPEKLSDTARALLISAAMRGDHLIQLPRLPVAAARQVIRSLIQGVDDFVVALSAFVPGVEHGLRGKAHDVRASRPPRHRERRLGGRHGVSRSWHSRGVALTFWPAEAALATRSTVVGAAAVTAPATSVPVGAAATAISIVAPVEVGAAAEPSCSVTPASPSSVPRSIVCGMPGLPGVSLLQASVAPSRRSCPPRLPETRTKPGRSSLLAARGQRDRRCSCPSRRSYWGRPGGHVRARRPGHPSWPGWQGTRERCAAPSPSPWQSGDRWHPRLGADIWRPWHFICGPVAANHSDHQWPVNTSAAAQVRLPRIQPWHPDLGGALTDSIADPCLISRQSKPCIYERHIGSIVRRISSPTIGSNWCRRYRS